MRGAVLFLEGQYRARVLSLFSRLAEGRLTVAVDGGYRFFLKVGLSPDVLLGDFDSLTRIPRNLPKSTEVIRFPARKDSTDAELAVRYCLKRRVSEVDIVQPSFGDPDHYVGNVMLLRLVDRWNRKHGRHVRARLVGATEEIVLVHDSVHTVRDAVGHRVSVLPLSERVRYSCSGTDYAARDILIRAGETVGLRNRITAARARFAVKGEALLMRRWGS